MPTTRRGFLKKGLLGGALLSLGGLTTLALRGSAGVKLPEGGLKNLSSREYAVLVAIAGRFIPSGPLYPSLEQVDFAKACDAIVGMLDDTARTEVKQVMMLFENALAGFVFGRRVTPFSRLPPEEQDVVLQEWRDSSITVRRSGWTALRTLVASSYFQSKATWPTFNYPGPTPGIYDPTAPQWKGGGLRPPGNGVMREPT